MTPNSYLEWILDKYKLKDTNLYLIEINNLKRIVEEWAGSCFVEFILSWSRAKWTWTSIASDIDYVVSLSSWCNASNWWLSGIYESLYSKLLFHYPNVRKQNVSIRVQVRDLKIDITPARKQPEAINYHSIYVSKKSTRQQTNIKRHNRDILLSGRLYEIRLLKIWRELNIIDFSSIYMEYLALDILKWKPLWVENLANNFRYLLTELSKDIWSPLDKRIVDPANSNNILSDLLTTSEKNIIKNKAKLSISKKNWGDIIW